MHHEHRQLPPLSNLSNFSNPSNPSNLSNPSTLSHPQRWIFSEDAPTERIDDFAWFDRWLGDKLRAAPKPLALLAYDDTDAARALGACLAAGLSVPEDVAILGIGGDRLICENQSVPISSIEHDQ